MKYNKYIALGLSAALILGTTGTAAYAEDTALIEITENEDSFYEETGIFACEETIDDGGELVTATDSCGGPVATDDSGDGLIESDDDYDGLIESDDDYDELFEADEDMLPGSSEETPDEIFEAEEEVMEIEETEIANNAAESSWLALFTKENGVIRQVIIFAKADGSWADEKGNLYTQMDDGSWTDANGVVYHEIDKESSSEDPGSPLIEDGDSDSGKDGKGSGPDPSTVIMKMNKKLILSVITSTLDVLMKKTDVEFGVLLGPLKTIITEVFGLGGSNDPNAVILEQLEEIDKHLDRMEESLKEHMENVVALDSIGGEFQKVANAIEPLENKIGDATGLYTKGKIDKDELNKRLAAMYSSGEYNSLMQALSGATNAYGGSTSYTLDQRSIFGAAYNLQCSHVMFSGEAVDCVTPYLLRQLCTYLKGYALINTVLDAYEWINGTDSTTKTREKMFKNLGGYVNGEIDEKNPGVFGLYSEFFNTYRYTFVNRSSNRANHIKLGRELMTMFGFSESMLGHNGPVASNDKLQSYTPPCMSKFPLSSEQMTKLIGYAADKNISLYDLLVNNVGFDLYIVPNIKALSIVGFGNEVTPDTIVSTPTAGSQPLRYLVENGETYMPVGPQYFTYECEIVFGRGSSSPSYNFMQAVKMNSAGAKEKKLTVAYSGDKNRTSTAVNATMMFFVKA